MSSRYSEDAIDLLIAGHEKLLAMFMEYGTLKGGKAWLEKENLVSNICLELTVHMMVQEEIFYPAVRKAIHDDALIDQALVEHAGATDLIDQLQEMEPDDDLYDAKVTVLGDEVEHHARREQKELFTRVKKAKLDMAALGEQMQKRKNVLMEELGGIPESAE